MVLVNLGLAIICFAGQCYPALIGARTPIGEYQLDHRSTPKYGYGGDVLMFKETETEVYSIHRVITFNPTQRRVERLTGEVPPNLRIISDGCINVMPEVYEKLVDCCSDDQLTIKE